MCNCSPVFQHQERILALKEQLIEQENAFQMNVLYITNVLNSTP
jgi:hypothetical protein